MCFGSARTENTTERAKAVELDVGIIDVMSGSILQRKVEAGRAARE